MCGIIGYISKQKQSDANLRVIDQYEDQFSRGTQGFGLIEIDKNKFNVSRATEPVKALMDIRFSTAKALVFHHRAPTSTSNKIQQTHPIKVEHDELKSTYYVIHNGVLQNEDDLFKKHTGELGYVYTTLEKTETTAYQGYQHWNSKFNDSEALAIELVRFLEGLSPEMDVKGSAAFIAVEVDKKTNNVKRMFWGRNESNPLELLETPSGLLIASSIYNQDAEKLPAKTYEILDLETLFKAKEMPDKIQAQVTKHDLKFKVEPPKAETSTHTGYSAGRVSTVSTSVAKKENEEKESSERYEGLSKREAAALRMAERITEEVAQDIDDLCTKMAYNELDPDEITAMVSAWQDIFTDRNESWTKRKVREMFNRSEDRELAEAKMEAAKDYKGPHNDKSFHEKSEPTEEDIQRHLALIS